MKYRFAASVTVAVAATLLGMTPAHAAGPSGSEACPVGNVCLYYNSPPGWGSFEHWSPGFYWLDQGYTFRDWGNGSGYGQPVANNAASIVNNTNKTWYVCAAGNSGACESFPPNYAGSLGATYNNDWTLGV